MTNAAIDLFATDVVKSIAAFEDRKNFHKARFWVIKTAEIILGALVTILLGIQNLLLPDNKNLVIGGVAFVLSVITSALITYENATRDRSLWVQYTITRNRLRRLQFELANLKVDLPSEVTDLPPAVADLLSRQRMQYQAILDEANGVWTDLYSPPDNSYKHGGKGPESEKPGGA